MILSTGTFPGKTIGKDSAVPVKELNPVDILENKSLLEAELILANSSGLYVIVDLRNEKIELKARGLVLREWLIISRRFFGYPIPLKALLLQKKNALFPPKRQDIKPGQNKDNKDYKPDILEIDDMPSGYALYIEGGVRLYIKPNSTSLFSALLNFGRSLKWYTAPPLLTVWNSFSGQSFTAVDIVLMDSRESRSLYWTFMEGTPCLFVPPGNLSIPPQ